MSSSDSTPQHSYAHRPAASGPDAPTAVLTPVGADSGPDLGDRLADASSAARRRVALLDGNARLAWVGALLTALAFLALPYVGSRGSAAEIGGRLWWRPILVIAAAILVTAATRRDVVAAPAPTVVAAVAVAAAAATESGLFALVSTTANPRIGFYLMLTGAILVLVAALRAALRPST